MSERARLVAELNADAATGAARNGDEAAQGAGGTATPYAAIKRERVEWLWSGRVPAGMITLLVGDPGLGKSTVTCHLAARVTRAGGTVLLATAEDAKGAVVRPRLEAADADLNRVLDVTLRRDGIDEGVVLPDDHRVLDELAARHQPSLVVIDPLMAHLGGAVNSWRDQSIREALAPIYRLAETHRCAVIVVAHLNKAAGADPLHRIGGSIGVPAAARSALLLARDPDDPDRERGDRRVLAHVKSNVAPLAASLACRVQPTMLPDDARTSTVRLVIDGEHDANGADLLARRPDNGEATELDDAKAFLRDELGDGARPVKAVKREAKDAGISDITLRRAKSDLAVNSVKGDMHEGWTWALPEGAQGGDEHLREREG